MKAIMALLIGSVAFAQFPQKTHSPWTFHYGPEITTLDGHLETHWEYGPPGFGETPKTDPHFKILVLRLDHPIDVLPPKDVEPDGNDEEKKGIQRVQLWCADGVKGCTANLKTLTRCAIRVKGTLHVQIAPMEFYPLNMDVSDMETLDCPK